LERSFFYDLLPWSDSLPDNFRKREPKSVCAIKLVSNPISFRAVFIKTDAVYGAFTKIPVFSGGAYSPFIFRQKICERRRRFLRTSPQRSDLPLPPLTNIH
jgi:hypothetical protein